MAQYIEKRELKIRITKEQFWAVYHFFNYNEWDLQEAIICSEWSLDEEQNQQGVGVGGRLSTTATSDNRDNDDNGNDEYHYGMNQHQEDNNQNFDEQGMGAGDGDGDNVDNNQLQEQICQHCFLSPCVTVCRQSWLGHGAVPHFRNAPLRKKKYKLFWKIISERGGWLHPNYVKKKQELLNRGMDDSIVWTPREIMPECVLNLVRELYPNPPGQPYMGHKWW